MNNIPEYASTSEEAGDNVDGGIVLFPTDNDDIGQAVPTPNIDTPINKDAPFSYPYAVGVDYTDENIKRHVDAFYKLVFLIFYLQGRTAKLIDREKYKEIKTALLRHHHGELFATLKREVYLVIHYWKKIYALVITGDEDDDSNVLLVARLTGLSADRTVCYAKDVLCITFLEQLFADLLGTHLPGHSKGRTMRKCISDIYNNIPLTLCKIFTDVCPCCIEQQHRQRPVAGLRPIIRHGLGVHGQVDLINFQSMPDGVCHFLLNYIDHGIKILSSVPIVRK